MDFKWSDRQYDLKTFVRKHSKNLPIIVRVTEGFCGLDEKDDYSFGTDDQYRLTHLNKQPRVIVKDKIGRHISLPINRPMAFCLLAEDGTKGPPRRLKDLVEKLDEGDKLVVANDEQVDFWLSGDKKMATKMGVLTFVAEYEERYLVGNTISEDGLLFEPQVIPAYVSIRIALAEGLAGKPPAEFDMLREQFARESVDFKNYAANGNLEIMLFEGKVTDYKDYDYIKPTNFLRLDANLSPELQMVAERQGPKDTKPPALPEPRKIPRIPSRSEKLSQQETPPLKPPPRTPIAPTENKDEDHDENYEVPNPSMRPPNLKPKSIPPAVATKTWKNQQPSSLTTASENDTIPTRPPIPPPRNSIAPDKASTIEQRKKNLYINNIGLVIPQPMQTQSISEHDTYEDPDQAEKEKPIVNEVKDDCGLYEDIDDNRVEQISPSPTKPVPNVIRSESVPGAQPAKIHEVSRSNSARLHEMGSSKKPPAKTPAEPHLDNISPIAQSQQNISQETDRLKEIRQMGLENICDLLDVLKLSQYKDLFRKEGIDGDLLADLTVEDLVQDLGFRNVEAKKLYKNITQAWVPK